MKETEIQETNSKIIRGVTNSGTLCKHYITILTAKDKKPVLSISKLLLVDYLSVNVESLIKHGFKIVKDYRNYCLIKQDFAVRIETFNKINELISSDYK